MIESIVTPLKSSIHFISSALLVPSIVVLLLLVAITVIELGALASEAFTVWRRGKIDLGQLLEVIKEQDLAEISGEIANSRLCLRHRLALNELIRHHGLPSASLQALARQLLSREETYYATITNKTDLVARLGPMFGLMATLIPLGPGLIALGQGDTKTLADSLLTAFDATVSGLAAAGVSYAISRVRKSWYESDMCILEALMEGLLEVLDRERGTEEQKAEGVV